MSKIRRKNIKRNVIKAAEFREDIDGIEKKIEKMKKNHPISTEHRMYRGGNKEEFIPSIAL